MTLLPPPPPTETLVERARTVAALADDCVAVPLQSSSLRERIAQLREHVHSFILPRALSLDAPLVVLLFGPTGAGKSSLANAIAGGRVSATGVLRPTTRQAVVVAARTDRDALQRGALAGLPAERVRWQPIEWAAGVAIVDSPDIDSIELANRDLADRLVEAADVAVFVTTATRYADQVPWHVLARAAERRLPLVVVVNRLPPDPAGRSEVLDDVARLLARASLVGADDGAALTLVPVSEGEVSGEAGAAQLDADAVAPLLERIGRLREDSSARRNLVARSFAGALAGLEPMLQTVADDLDREAIDVDALRRTAESAYRAELAGLRDALKAGVVLRTEILRRWQDYVGADWLTRSFSSGLARIESTVRTAFRGTSDAPVAVRDETRAELAALAEAHASDAARRTAAAWADTPAARTLVDADPELWTASPGFRTALGAALDEWLAEIASSIAATGEPKRRLARGAATGVNAASIGVMLAVFLHTGGLTGAEVGVAAGTALVNQRLLEAIFGEATIVRLVDEAARRLDGLLGDAFAADAARFTRQVPDGARLRELGASLRAESEAIASIVETMPGTSRAVDVAVSTGTESPGRKPEAVPASAGRLLGSIRRLLFGERVDG